MPSARWKADRQHYKWMYQADNDRTYQSSSHHEKRPQESVYLLMKVIPSPTKHMYPPKKAKKKKLNLNQMMPHKLMTPVWINS